MIAALERLAAPRILRKLVGLLVAAVIVALVLATIAIIRDARTKRDVNAVTVRLSTPPTKAQTLLWKQLKAMSPVQRQYLRVLLKRHVKRRKPRAARAPARAPAAAPAPPRPPSVLRSKPPVALPPPPVVLPAPAPPVAIPPPAVAPAPLAPVEEKPGRRLGQQGGKPGKGKGRGRP
jgi:hypothetical protein